MLNTERQKFIRETFDAAAALPAENQTDFVQRQAGPDTALAESVLRLLRAARAGQNFMAKPPLAAAPAPGIAGMRLAAYRIVRELGSGGMGVVYLAIRADDVYRRTVALKIIRPEFNSPQMIERFVQERHILAQLDHPNIARIVDGGTTPTDLPYFVMDYVDGRPIDVFANDRSATFDQRLNLFRQACGAVQYLHENHVLHRDLKPANMLVTPTGVVKLLDFGIAKLIDVAPDAVVKTAPIVTIGYASPEQLSGQPTSPASDVYSLAVILYELLTGRRPHELAGRSLSQNIAAVTREDVKPPSARLEPASAPTTDSSPEQLRRRLRGDLDAILLKALRKEPELRYTSVAAFSDDIERCQAGLPVAARDGATLYTVSRNLRRHRYPIAAGLLLTASLCWAGYEEWRVNQLTADLNRLEALEQAPVPARTGVDPQADARLDQGLRQLAHKYKTTFPQLVDTPLASRAREETIVRRDLTWLDAIQPQAAGNQMLAADLGRAYLSVAQAQWSENQPSLKDSAASLKTCDRLLDLIKQAPPGVASSSGVQAVEQQVANQMNSIQTNAIQTAH